jgi:hypothetical protein
MAEDGRANQKNRPSKGRQCGPPLLRAWIFDVAKAELRRGDTRSSADNEATKKKAQDWQMARDPSA